MRCSSLFSPTEFPKPNPHSVIDGDEKIQSPVPKTFRRENLRDSPKIRRFQEIKRELQSL
jgi:hypothetical protein